MMTDDNTTTATNDTTTAADNIDRTPALDKMGLARCRKDNKLFSWREGGSCKVCGACVEEATAPATAPAVKPKRARKATPTVPPVKHSKRKRNGSAAAASKNGKKS